MSVKIADVEENMTPFFQNLLEKTKEKIREFDQMEEKLELEEEILTNKDKNRMKLSQSIKEEIKKGKIGVQLNGHSFLISKREEKKGIDLISEKEKEEEIKNPERVKKAIEKGEGGIRTIHSSPKDQPLEETFSDGKFQVFIGSFGPILNCPRCGRIIEFFLTEDGNIELLADSERKKCDGEDWPPVLETTLSIDSGSILMDDNLRKYWHEVEPEDVHNSRVDSARSFVEYGKRGLAHGYVGSVPLKVYLEGEKIRIGSQSIEEDFIKIPGEKKGRIETGLWWFSICDKKELEKRYKNLREKKLQSQIDLEDLDVDEQMKAVENIPYLGVNEGIERIEELVDCEVEVEPGDYKVKYYLDAFVYSDHKKTNVFVEITSEN